jgi:hypothetical protein
METERITLSQRERGRWKVLHEVQQMHRSQVGTGSHVRNALQTHRFELLAFLGILGHRDRRFRAIVNAIRVKMIS